MEEGNRPTTNHHKMRKHILQGMALLVALILLILFVFVRCYTPYVDRLLYAERLNQMEEVTTQLFAGLEDIVQLRWDNADTQRRYLMDARPQNMDELLAFLAHQGELSGMDGVDSTLIAVDTDGDFYTQEGPKGPLSDPQNLADNPERINYVYHSASNQTTSMVFLLRLSEPISVSDEAQSVTISYYGVSQDMTELLPYFGCSAYDNSNRMYVLDADGQKIFISSATDYLRGSNIYDILSGMEYLHGSSFEQAKAELEQNGVAYSNAVAGGQEYYYALYRMNSAEWTLLFTVPSSYVAVNTVELINSTTRIIIVFSILIVLLSGFLIFRIMRKQQKLALEQERKNNLRLEQVNTELTQAVEVAKSATRKAEAASERAQRSMEEANRANRAKSDFLANLSHDIRTPMNAIVGITNLMEHDRDDPNKMERYIHKVQSSSKHLLSLINDILDMSQIEANRITLNQESVNLAEQIGQVDSIIWPQIEARSQHFIIRAHEIVHENLICDSVRLRQIFINLLSNASKYTPVGGSVQLDLAELPSDDPTRATIEITVSDTGSGMTPEFLTHIFDPFTRAQRSTVNQVQGTGLGLTIIKRIIDRMGGSIQVKSEPGIGSRFQVLLPLPIDTTAAPALNSRGVLLISEEERLTHNAVVAFRNTDVPLQIATNPEEAKRILQASDVDTILLSGHLHDPALSDIIASLRSEAQDAAVLFCVDYARQDQASAALRISGIDGLITRPFFLSSLVHVLNQMRAAPPAAESEETPQNALNGLHFLCAEDNGLNAEILRAILDMNGASCTIYPDGDQLLHAFKDIRPGDYNAILMDVQMPVMNGLDATRAIRNGSNPLGKTIPIIAMTANAFSSDVQDCLNAGMNAHLAKPLDLAALQRAIRAYVTPLRPQVEL